MRPNGRSPPFLAIGLFIALCVMGFNYWNLSAKNADQANEISIISAEKLTARSSAEKRIESLNQQVESLQRDINAARAQKETETNRLAEEKRNIEDECEKDQRRIQAELEQCRELSNELKVKVESFRCDEQKCQSFTAAAREQALRDVHQAAGVAPLLVMHQKGIHLGSFGEELNDEFNLEIRRQQQIVQLQQAGLQPNLVVNQQPNQVLQQPNQAGEQQKIADQQPDQQPGNQANQQPDQDKQLPGQQQDQANKAEDGKNLPYQDPHYIHDTPGVKVYGNEENRGAYFHPGDGNLNEAGNLGQKQFGSLDSLADHLRDQNRDTGIAGDSNLPVLPKPGNGKVPSSLGSQLKETETTPTHTNQTGTATTTTPTKHTIVAVIKSTHHKDVAGPDDDDEGNQMPMPADDDDDVDDDDDDDEEDEDN